MILTGKAKEDFETWLESQEVAPYRAMFYSVPEIVQFAFITEWLDSVGIYVEIQIQTIRNDQYWRGKVDNCLFDELEYKLSRQEATKAAIIKANEIYNSKS